jgi:hypothetical protein
MRPWNVSGLFLGVILIGAPSGAIDGWSQPHNDRTVDVGVREALQQYSVAFASLNAAAVKKVQPSIDTENLKAAFKQMKALQVSIDDMKILSTEGAVTRVSCRVTQTLTPKAGSKQTIAVIRVIRLHKQDDVWVIDAFER